MKSKNASQHSRIVFLNVLGAAGVASCMAGVVWFVIVQADRTSSEIATYRTSMDDARSDLRQIRATRERLRERLKQQAAQLTAAGQLPRQSPAEPYFQTLSALAAEHRLQVVRHKPLSPREYPGLLEQRFTYVVSGATADVIRFLRSVENTSYWADVGFLEIKNGDVQPVGDHRKLTATLTMSLFSAPPDEADRQS